MIELSPAVLHTLPPQVRIPAFDRTRVDIGILHLGLGAFHRAHQAVYTDDILAADPRWGICGVSLKTPRAIAPLAAQDGLYTLLTRSDDGIEPRVIGSVRQTLFAGADRAGMIARFADPMIMVVSATVTERGIATIRQPASSMSRIRTSCMTSPIKMRRSRRWASWWPALLRAAPRVGNR